MRSPPFLGYFSTISIPPGYAEEGASISIKALPWTEIPLRFIPASEHWCSASFLQIIQRKLTCQNQALLQVAGDVSCDFS
jgi:hypothetical protein